METSIEFERGEEIKKNSMVKDSEFLGIVRKFNLLPNVCV